LCDELPRCVQRRPSDNKKKLDLEDIHSLWMHLDVNRVELPLCTAANLKTVPPVGPSQANICTLTSNVSSLQQEIVTLSTLKKTVMQLNEKIKVAYEAVCERKPTYLRQAVDNFNSQVMDDLTPECSTASDKSPYAGVAVAGDVTDYFIIQTNRKKRQNKKSAQTMTIMLSRFIQYQNVTDGQTDGQTDRQTDGRTDRQNSYINIARQCADAR